MVDENTMRLAGKIDALNEVMDAMNALQPEIDGLTDIEALVHMNQRWSDLLSRIKTMGDDAGSQLADLRRGIGIPDKMN